MLNFKELIETVETGNAWNVRDDLKDLPTVPDILKHQPDNGFAVCVVNVTGSLNLGSMLRNAVIFGANRFYIAGRARFDKRSTVGAENYIDIQHIDLPIDEETLHMDYQKICYRVVNDGYTPYLVEQGGTNHREVTYDAKPCFLFGNEGVGFDQEFVWWFDRAYRNVISINQPGILRSLNVSNASAIIMENFVHAKNS